ncbi:hypothetical protein EV2_015350 [Malus domestica]
MTNYFHNIFTSTRNLEDSEIIGAMEPRLTSEMNRHLEMRISEEEVRKTVFQMQPAKAPGPDGMNPFFYQWYWHIVGVDVTNTIRNFFASGRLLKQVNFTHVTLIPKSKCPEKMSQIRSISLCNIFFRIISKVMANQLKLLLPAVVSQNQSAFVLGRNISNNTILALEIFNYLFRRRHGKKGFVSLKLDISKGLSAILSHKERTGQLSGIAISTAAPTASGQMVNLQKSEICFSKNVKRHMQGRLVGILGERLWKRLQGWKGKLLSAARNEVLIKAIAQTIPTYTMSYFLLAKHICEDLNKLMQRFGGMGMRVRERYTGARGINYAALSVKSLVARVLKAKYFPNSTFIDADVKIRASYRWKSICAVRKVINVGSWWMVGMGDSVRIWEDSWIPIPSLFKPFFPKPLGPHMVGHQHPTPTHIPSLWLKVWNANVLPKVKVCVWKLANEFVPTRVNLTKRHLGVDMECVMCCTQGELTIHLMADCAYAKCA